MNTGIISSISNLRWGHALAQLVETLCYSRKVAGSIPGGVIGLSLSEMSTRDISWG